MTPADEGISELRLLSGGAAQSVASALAPLFFAETGVELRARFAAIGALPQALLAGERCDVLIASQAMIEELALAGTIVADSVAALGSVHTGIAVRAGDALPAMVHRDQLRTCLAAATAIHLPDPERATAGIHFVRMLRALALYESLAPRLRSYSNGVNAMAALAEALEARALGCAQVTEISAVPGVRLVGPLPGEFELATAYAVGVCAAAREPALASQFARMVSGPESRELRTLAGFEL